MDVKQLIAGARLPETGVPICMRGDLVRQHEALEAALDEARTADAEDSLAAGGEARKIAEEIQALEGEMREHTHTFGLRGLPRNEYRALLAEFPPRDGNKEDEAMGANAVTWPIALIARCCIDPVMTLEQAHELADVLTDGQLLQLYGGALGLNKITVDAPKSVAASAILARTASK